MAAPPAEVIKHGWDMADELVTLLKTAHPLLALTMEQFAEQIRERLKPGPEEEVYRMSGALLTEALNVGVRLMKCLARLILFRRAVPCQGPGMGALCLPNCISTPRS
jgi:hypothetical protein